jgi:hypothetical protein
MPRQSTSKKTDVEILQKGPIVIAGQPGRLRANLQLRNSGPERLRLGRSELIAKDMAQAVLKAGRHGLTPTLRFRAGRIRPGQDSSVALTLTLDRHTPPGEYHAEVNIAGRTQPVTIHVLEKIGLQVQPSQLVIENLPNQKIHKRVVMTNTGNVALTIGEIGAIYLDDDLLTCRTLRAAAAAVDDELRPLDEYLARILLEAKHVAESSGILRVHNRSSGQVLQPGQSHPFDLEIRVPDTLDRRGRYRGTAAIYTANLSFVIVPSSGPPVPPSPKTPRSTTKKAS